MGLGPLPHVTSTLDSAQTLNLSQGRLPKREGLRLLGSTLANHFAQESVPPETSEENNSRGSCRKTYKT
ncbi:unnamed protein product, partial [Sphenostylis stenocarpa]